MDRIVLKVGIADPKWVDIIQLSREAATAVQELRCKTGMSAKCLVSEIIMQAKDLIDIKYPDAE